MNGLKTFSGPGPSHTSSPNCLSIQRRKPSLGKKESLPKVIWLIRLKDRTYESQFQVHCSFNSPELISLHPSSTLQLECSFIHMPDHVPPLIKDLQQLMALQGNIQLLILACETFFTGVSPPYLHAPQPSMASPAQHTYPHTCTHFFLTKRMGEHEVLRGESMGTELFRERQVSYKMRRWNKDIKRVTMKWKACKAQSRM